MAEGGSAAEGGGRSAADIVNVRGWVAPAWKQGQGADGSSSGGGVTLSAPRVVEAGRRGGRGGRAGGGEGWRWSSQWWFTNVRDDLGAPPLQLRPRRPASWPRSTAAGGEVIMTTWLFSLWILKIVI